MPDYEAGNKKSKRRGLRALQGIVYGTEGSNHWGSLEFIVLNFTTEKNLFKQKEFDL